MEFRGYEKMSETTADWQIPSSWKADKKVHPKKGSDSKYTWCVTEKCHGSSFVFVCDGSSVQAGKRSALLSADEHFFGYRACFAKHEDRVWQLFERVRERFEDLARVYVHGELFGGVYDAGLGQSGQSEDTKEDLGDEQDVVQTEIQYCKTLEFYAFDLAVERSQIPSKTYVDYGIVMEWFAEFGFVYAKPLLLGSLTDCLNFSVDFPTKIPAMLGMPALKDNMAEGIVIKPLEEKSVTTSKGHAIRAIVKKKAQRFRERVLEHAKDNRAAFRERGSLSASKAIAPSTAGGTAVSKAAKSSGVKGRNPTPLAVPLPSSVPIASKRPLSTSLSSASAKSSVTKQSSAPRISSASPAPMSLPKSQKASSLQDKASLAPDDSDEKALPLTDCASILRSCVTEQRAVNLRSKTGIILSKASDKEVAQFMGLYIKDVMDSANEDGAFVASWGALSPPEQDSARTALTEAAAHLVERLRLSRKQRRD